MLHTYLKAIHMIGFVTWFAALFYLVRLLVYHAEASGMEEPKRTILRAQYALMGRRLYYIIAVPGMVITLICGVWMLIHTPAFLQMGWMHVKLAFLLLLVVYHHITGALVKRMPKGDLGWTSWQFRLFNELPTLVLVSVVFLAVFKNSVNFLYGLGGLIGLGLLLFVLAKVYRSIREKKN